MPLVKYVIIHILTTTVELFSGYSNLLLRALELYKESHNMTAKLPESEQEVTERSTCLTEL